MYVKVCHYSLCIKGAPIPLQSQLDNNQSWSGTLKNSGVVCSQLSNIQ